MEIHLLDKEEIYADFIRKHTPEGCELICQRQADLLAHNDISREHFLIVDTATMGISTAALKAYLSKKGKHCSVCLMTHHMPSAELSDLKNQGLEAYLWKYAALQNLSNGLKRFLAGHKVYLPDERWKPPCDIEPLTPREQHVLTLIAAGRSTIEIADEINLSVHTINTYRKNILKKFNAKSPSDLIIKAIKLGFIHV